MTVILELRPEIEAKAQAEAKARGLALEKYLSSVIERSLTEYADDGRIRAIDEAMRDELFLADLAETMEDFKHVDLE
jgi:hypothetical protein